MIFKITIFSNDFFIITEAEVSTKPIHAPFGVQRNLHKRRGVPSLMGLDGVGGRRIESSGIPTEQVLFLAGIFFMSSRCY